MKQYAITGYGDAPEAVIHEGLRELMASGDTLFYVPWVGGLKTKPSEGMRKVYDFLVDNNATFTLLAKARDMIHPALAGAAHQIKESGTEAPDLNFKNLPQETVALILWDEENPERTDALVCEYFDKGHSLLDLSNGLTPINVVSPVDEPPAPAPVVEQEDELEPLTEEDIDSMPPGVKKQFDKAVEVEVVSESKVVEQTAERTGGIHVKTSFEAGTESQTAATIEVCTTSGDTFHADIPEEILLIILTLLSMVDC